MAELRANETLNYTYEIKGAGNLALITAPSINPPADFDKYDPKSNDNITVDLNGVSGPRDRLVKISAKTVRQGRSMIFQIAQVMLRSLAASAKTGDTIIAECHHRSAKMPSRRQLIWLPGKCRFD